MAQPLMIPIRHGLKRNIPRICSRCYSPLHQLSLKAFSTTLALQQNQLSRAPPPPKDEDTEALLAAAAFASELIQYKYLKEAEKRDTTPHQGEVNLSKTLSDLQQLLQEEKTRIEQAENDSSPHDQAVKSNVQKEQDGEGLNGENDKMTTPAKPQEEIPIPEIVQKLRALYEERGTKFQKEKEDLDQQEKELTDEMEENLRRQGFSERYIRIHVAVVSGVAWVLAGGTVVVLVWVVFRAFGFLEGRVGRRESGDRKEGL